MDVEIGATDVPLFGTLRRSVFGRLAAVAALILVPASVLAIGESGDIHSSASRQMWDRKLNRVELIGNAVVSQPGETITADSITMDKNARTLHAKGNCVYVSGDLVIHGEEMYFNMDTRTGSIVGGRVSNDQFTLSGERINKLGPGRFQTHWGEYTTCRDCPQSWSLVGKDVDMEIEGYAYLSEVTAKIKDAPAFWLPYLIVPMKTRRQSGLLFPLFGISEQNGATFVLPFFWAISRSTDMTIALGEYTARGMRAVIEGRYALSPGSGGQANLYYLRDGRFKDSGGNQILPYRWGLNLAQRQELSLGIVEKLRFSEMSDNLYPIQVGDVPGHGEMFTGSELSFSRASSDMNAFVSFQRYRNLLNLDTDEIKRAVEFDSRTVQVFPKALITTNDRFLLGTPVAAGFTIGLSNFTRASGPFDYDSCSTCSIPPNTDLITNPPPFRPGVDPIRNAMRVSMVPSLYTTLRPLDFFSLVPSVKYFAYSYDFHGAMNSLSRGYMLFQADLSMQIEKVYETSDPEKPRVKHLIRPMLTYSRIPESLIREDRDHPFIQQINSRQGFNFDNHDIVPIDSTPSNFRYFVPLGDSLSYGVTTQLIRRNGKVDADTSSYLRMVEFSAGQSYNFLQLRRPASEREPFSRFFSNLFLDFGRYSTSMTYLYYPYVSTPRNVLSTSATYVIDRDVRQRILTFDRTLTLGYSYDRSGCIERSCGTSNLTGTLSYSLSDYLLPSLSVSHSFITHRFFEESLSLAFQSPSRCWKLGFNVSNSIDRGTTWGMDLSINLTGSGFGGVGDFASQMVSK